MKGGGWITNRLRLADANKGSVWVSLQLTLTPHITTNRDRMHRRASCLPQIATGNRQLYAEVTVCLE